MERILATRFMLRNSTGFYAVAKQQIYTSVRLLNKNDESDSSDSDNEKTKQKSEKIVENGRDEKAKQETVNLLNSLLSSMSTAPKKQSTYKSAVPKKKPFPRPPKQPSLEEKIVGAANDVAASMGGNVEENKQLLLDKVFSAGLPETQETEKVSEKKVDDQPTASLSELLSGMKIDRSRKPVTTVETFSLSRSARVQDLARKFQARDNQNVSNIQKDFMRPKETPANLNSGDRLNIFDTESKTSQDSSIIPTWESLYQNELKMLVTHPPNNIFQEMVQWTDQGILWKFPIDNEQGLEAEQNVHFSEHVFMERHLQGWCPKKGPIRHFMELVCVGLSKNPYMTVEEKIEHIFWFKEYFGQKQELLKELGAIQQDIVPEKTEKNLFAIEA